MPTHCKSSYQTCRQAGRHTCTHTHTLAPRGAQALTLAPAQHQIYTHARKYPVQAWCASARSGTCDSFSLNCAIFFATVSFTALATALRSAFVSRSSVTNASHASLSSGTGSRFGPADTDTARTCDMSVSYISIHASEAGIHKVQGNVEVSKLNTLKQTNN